MSRPPALSPGGAEAPTTTGDLRLQGHRLAFARTAWAIAAVLSLVVTASSIPIDLRLLQTVCTGASCIDSEQLTAVGAALAAAAWYLGWHLCRSQSRPYASDHLCLVWSCPGACVAEVS